jgi:hypothetical protein
MRRASSFAQSSSAIPGGFTYGATARDFFIPAVALFGGMVVAEGGGVEGERRRGRGGQGEGRQDGGAGGALGVNRLLEWREMKGLVRKLEGYRKNRWEGVCVAGKGVPGVGSELPRCVGAPDRIPPHKGQHRSAGSFIRLASIPTRF